MSDKRKETWEWIKAILLAVALALVVRIFLFEAIVIHQSSMYPTFAEGDRVIIGKLKYYFEEPERGDVVVFKTEDMTRPFIKRAIGLPGETVEIRDNAVYIDGERLEEPYIYQTMYGEYGPVTVPEGHLFVLGDNRNNSEDSRFESVGMIPIEDIRGRVRLRLWPLGKIQWISDPYAEESSGGE
jgi:signal peptidase I